jgi:hypothetical protein
MHLNRRNLLLAAGAGLAAQTAVGQAPALREMQIYTVPELALRIWVENQPPWQAELSQATGRPSFVAQSPDNYHPPTVMTYASWPDQSVSDVNLIQVAQTALARASQNFGLNTNQARSVAKLPASHGVLQGLEAAFTGKVDAVAVDVRIFVGQAAGRFPVALSIYTLAGKMGHLSQVVRRSWGKLAYLSA